MLKQIKKLTALLFVAATMFTFASCNKDNSDDNTSGGGSGGSQTTISESQLIGTWEFDSNSHPGIDIRSDHTCTIIDGVVNHAYIWTLSKSTFHATDTWFSEGYGGTVTEDIVFEIKSVSNNTMTIEGTRKWSYDTEHPIDYSGTLHKVQ